MIVTTKLRQFFAQKLTESLESRSFQYMNLVNCKIRFKSETSKFSEFFWQMGMGGLYFCLRVRVGYGLVFKSALGSGWARVTF